MADDAKMSKIMDQLTFPHSVKKPELSADELLRLDALADQLELQRLNFRGWSVCKFYRALMQCHLLQKF